MNKENNILALKKFLNRELALGAFMDNMRAYNTDWDDLKTDRPSNYYITSCFIWASTPEGYDYWEKLSRKWLSY